MKTKRADRYTKIVEWSEEDRCYIGRCPELFLGGVHGRDRATVFAELCETVDEWIATMHNDDRPLPPPLAGREFSGKFLLRVDPQLHKMLALRALQDGDSLNNYVAKKLQSVA